MPSEGESVKEIEKELKEIRKELDSLKSFAKKLKGEGLVGYVLVRRYALWRFTEGLNRISDLANNLYTRYYSQNRIDESRMAISLDYQIFKTSKKIEMYEKGRSSWLKLELEKVGNSLKRVKEIGVAGMYYEESGINERKIRASSILLFGYVVGIALGTIARDLANSPGFSNLWRVALDISMGVSSLLLILNIFELNKNIKEGKELKSKMAEDLINSINSAMEYVEELIKREKQKNFK